VIGAQRAQLAFAVGELAVAVIDQLQAGRHALRPRVGQRETLAALDAEQA
jgi:hypothetical protein